MEKLNLAKTEWDLSPLLSGDNDPTIEKRRKKVEEISYKFINKWKNREDCFKVPAILKQALDEYENLSRGDFGDGEEGSGSAEGYYFWLRTQQDQSDPELKAKYNKIEEFSKRITNEMQFFILNIGKIPKDKQKDFLESKDLEKYKHYLERIFKKSKHWLSEKEEKILNLKEKTSVDNWISMVSDFVSREEREVLLENGKKERKTFEEISGLIDSQKKEVRDCAAVAINDILEKNSDVAEAEMNSLLEDKKINDELRNRPYPDYSRHLTDDIDKEVIDSLLDAVSKNFETAKKYYKLKAKLLGVPKLKYHERNVPIGKIEKKFSYEESINIVYEVFSNLDKKFSEITKKFVEKGQLDVFPRKGKRSGAFCVYWLISHPTYIMLNHTNLLNDVKTIAHELGHAINNELVKEKQHALYFGTSTATAEVASTFMEDFVIQRLMKDANDEMRLSLMMQKLNSDISSIFRQTAFYKFEQDLHGEFRKKGYLSKNEIGKIFHKHVASYLGEAVEISPGSENWWVHIPHFRKSFYTYSYSSGLLISKSLQAAVNENPQFIEKVKEFLSTGKSDSPKNIFAKMNLDITSKKFWEKGLKEVEKLLKETEDLAVKLRKI